MESAVENLAAISESSAAVTPVSTDEAASVTNESAGGEVSQTTHEEEEDIFLSFGYWDSGGPVGFPALGCH